MTEPKALVVAATRHTYRVTIRIIKETTIEVSGDSFSNAESEARKLLGEYSEEAYPHTTGPFIRAIVQKGD